MTPQRTPSAPQRACFSVTPRAAGRGVPRSGKAGAGEQSRRPLCPPALAPALPLPLSPFPSLTLSPSHPLSRSPALPLALALLTLLTLASPAHAQTLEPVTPPEFRGQIDAERLGTHDANRIRTRFLNYGMVGDYPADPIGVDLSVFHSVEVPKGSGVNYSDGITPYVLARIPQEGGRPDAHIMLTGYRERQATSPITNRVMRFEPRPGYTEVDPSINAGRSIAISNDPRTWPGAADPSGALNPALDPGECWYDKRNDPDDPGWCGSWNGFFGKRPNADQESFFAMDDQFYDAFAFYPDSRDRTRRGLGLRVEVRGFQWANPQAQNVIFWHYDIVNESTTTYEDIIFGLYMDSGVGGSARSCDGVPESDDDNARFFGFGENEDFDLNLVYTWDERGHGVGLASNCETTGYLGYAYLETPGDAFNNLDDDNDGMTDERRDSGPGQKIEGTDAIRAYFEANYNVGLFESFYSPLEERPAFIAGVWYTGDDDLDWVAEFSDTGADGIFTDDDNPPDTGERDGIPTAGEPNFDQTDINESDQIVLTGFKLNRIGSLSGGQTDNVVFFTDLNNWPEELYDQFTSSDPGVAFDRTVVRNYNVGFLFASGPFRLEAGRRERFSLALAYGQNLTELEDNVEVVQSIYNANYQFATPPPAPTVQAFAGDGRVTLVWDNAAERSADPVTNRNDFEGYRVYRSTDPNFLDAQRVFDGLGGGPIGNGRPVAQFDLANGLKGYSDLLVQGVAYYLGDDTGLTHTWTDSTATNGQEYYYAVTAYDRGAEEFGFYPSENAISVSRTPRGGTILPKNVVQVRPNAPVPGYVGAEVDDASVQHVEGTGVGTVRVRVLNSAAVPDGHTFRLTFEGSADSVRAEGYTLTDLTTGEVLFEDGRDFTGEGGGPVGAGVQPIVQTLSVPVIDSLATGFTPETQVSLVLGVEYVSTLSRNLARPGYPDDLLLTFSDVFVDTSNGTLGLPALPSKFRVTSARTGEAFPFYFRDCTPSGACLPNVTTGDRTLNQPGEFVEILVPNPDTGVLGSLWRLTVREGTGAAREGDVYRLALQRPFAPGDVFTFSVRGARIDPDAARSAFADEEPYVVPNPYVAAASFEPERFATAGRGERRMEFRAIPVGATIRIYTVRGQLVETLTHDGSTTGMVPWDLRTQDNLEIAAGLYLFHVDAGELGQFVGKFAVIK